jgi:hypothetical protein
MRLLFLLPALALLLSAAAVPRVEVLAGPGRITIRADGAPLSDVLDELSRKAGIEVVYEGPRPRHPVTARIVALPEEEAIARLLEGLPVGWALRRNANSRVGTLVIAGDPSRRPSVQPPRPSPSPGRPRVPGAASYPSGPDRASYPLVRP